MSDDPERLLSAGGADPLAQELLGSVRHVGPPAGAKEHAWREIVGQIAIGATVGAVASVSAVAAGKASASGLSSWALATKVVLVAAGGLALGGGYLALRSPAPLVASAAPPPGGTRVAIPALPPPLEKEAVSPAPPDDVAVQVERPHRSEPRELDRLKAESALLTEARAQLRSGNAFAAQASLERLQQQFPKGVLTQEREVLSIEVSYARGNVEGAKRRARAFVKAYPKSPHSAKLTRFLD